MDRIIREEARLIILKTLAGEVDGRLNSSLLGDALGVYGINKPRHWVHAEIRHLENLGAVVVTEAGTVLIAAITTRGQDHVERRAILDGVKRPSPQAV